MAPVDNPEQMLQKINSVISLCGRSVELATDHVRSLKYPPAILCQVLIECSALKAAFESLAVLQKYGKIPIRIIQVLEGPESSLVDGCTRALDDLDGLLEPYSDLSANGTARSCGELPYLQTIVDSLLALKAAVSSTSGADVLTFSTPPDEGSSGCEAVRLIKEEIEKEEGLDLLGYRSYKDNQADCLSHSLQGTGQWFLTSAEYSAWATDKSQTLFCPGIFGAGKTVMTAMAVDDIQRRFRHDPTVGIAFLYLDKQDSDEEYSEGERDILKILLRQFVEYGKDRPYSPTLSAMHQRHTRFGTEPSNDELLEALRAVMGNYSKTFIFVDSLHFMTPMTCDGCGPDDVVTLLTTLQVHLGTNLFFTSQPIPAIEKLFVSVPTLEIRAREEDLRLFLKAGTRLLPSFIRGNPKLQEELHDIIVSKADGMFFLVDAYAEDLQDTQTPRAARRSLQTSPQRVLRAHNDYITWIEDNYKGDGNIAGRILSWVAHAKCPLTLAELQQIPGVDFLDDCDDFDEDSLPIMEDILTACCGLVTVNKTTGIVDVAHWSTKEGIRDHFCTDEENIARQCIVYLEYKTFDDGPCQTDAELEERLAKYPFYKYAATHWAAHVSDCHHPARVSPFVTDFVGQGSLSPNAEAAVQVLFTCNGGERTEGYSQEYPREMSALHLAAAVGLRQIATNLTGRQQAHPPPLPGWGPPKPMRVHDSRGRSPLWYAADRGHRTTVEALVNTMRFDPNEADEDGETPVARAWAGGNGHFVGIMLKYGDAWGPQKDGGISKFVDLVKRPAIESA